MKKLCIVLLLAAAGKTLPAQTFYYLNPEEPSEYIFSQPQPGTAHNRFEFILPNNNRMIIEVTGIRQLLQFPNLDSLFQKVWDDLKPIYDSLTDPLMVRRVDYVSTSKQVKIRLKQYKPGSTYFSYKDDELVQLKVDQDTLRFKGYLWPADKDVSKIYNYNYYSVMLLLNNISDVAKLPDDLLSSGVRLLIEDLGRALKRSPKRAYDNFYYATYDLRLKKRVAPSMLNHMGFGRKQGVTLYAQAGLQYGRGEWIPSTGVGLEYFSNESRLSKFAVRLIWEPHFFFRRSVNDKLITDRNDFITIRVYSGFKSSPPSRAFEFNQNFSVGFLVYRKGEWFDRQTVKFSLPGLQARNIMLEPEFFMRKGFRAFSPSLKLVLHLE
jgi:hypothetical protein